MRFTRRRIVVHLGAGLQLLALPRAALAQQWPSKPIRAVIPFTAGSTIDIVGRIVLEALSQQLGQSIVVENRGGAGGTIGTAMVARADPDGYTILAHSSATSRHLRSIRTRPTTRRTTSSRWRRSAAHRTSW
jgi:tripartite-type tricarboxylate transporter receptor subunit TctC